MDYISYTIHLWRIWGGSVDPLALPTEPLMNKIWKNMEKRLLGLQLVVPNFRTPHQFRSVHSLCLYPLLINRGFETNPQRKSVSNAGKIIELTDGLSIFWRPKSSRAVHAVYSLPPAAALETWRGSVTCGGAVDDMMDIWIMWVNQDEYGFFPKSVQVRNDLRASSRFSYYVLSEVRLTGNESTRMKVCAHICNQAIEISATIVMDVSNPW